MNYFTTKRFLFLVPHKRCYEEFDKIDVFLNILEKSGIGSLIDSISKKDKQVNSGRKGYNPFNLFATILYCFSFFKGSLREIENLCLYDLRVMYLMEQKVPDYSSICRFINKYIVPYEYQYEIFTKITKTIIDELNIDISDNYLDGTKIEANANKYKFVWRPKKFHERLDIKIKTYLKELGYEINNNNLIKAETLYKILNEYAKKENIDINNIPSGRGSRPTKAQKNYKIGYGYLLKLIDYEEKEEICGDRNSYYKTDKDATAMVLKEDYYSKLSHDFHAAYNFQSMVSAGFIMMYGLYQDRNDFYTFVPMIDKYHEYYKKYPKNLCADSGYGIYTNYKYMREHNICNYVKFKSWKGEASGKNPQLFYTFDDGVMCLNTNIGEEISFNKIHQRSKGGKLYKFTGCNSCNYSYKCKEKMKPENRKKDYRIIELIPDFELLKEEARENLLSPKGIEMRINRSIQVEGGFGHIKNNMGYDRIGRCGLEKASAEIMLMCLGKNIRRLFAIMDQTNIKSNFWSSPNNLKKENFPFPKQKKKKD